jgi:protein-S-isoprenylcysteine O-methyltransferase Ste14
MANLIIATVRAFLLGAFALAVLLFLPAGTLDYWQAWIYIAVFMGSASAIGVYLSLNDPELLERRKNVGPAAEQSLGQKISITIGIVGFLGLMVFSALDHRFGWSPVPPFVSLTGDAWVALGLLIDLYVFRENRFGASTVQVFAEQRVISTGPYALVRHPMYAGVLVMAIGTPLALGSWLGLVVLALIMPGLIWRILDEERLLTRDLPGYGDYMRQVRYRLVPYLW